MKCLGCYKNSTGSYCRSCSKSLFDRTYVSSRLNFDAPKAENLREYQEHTKSLSISGVQLKYSLKQESDKLIITERGGTHILKPVPPTKFIAEPDAVPENEHLTMRLASQVFNIDTAENALIEFADGQPAYITKRFDRHTDGSKSLQEDFAQLTQRSEASNGKNFKYDGTYEEVATLIKQYVAASMPELEKYFELLIFNYLVSNGDAHLKNFSLTRKDTGEYGLTPAYDLMCTRIHTPSEQDIALDLYRGDMTTAFYKTYGFYGRPDFLELSGKLGLIPRRAERIIDRLTGLEQKAVTFIHQSFLPQRLIDQYVHLFVDKVHRFRLVV